MLYKEFKGLKLSALGMGTARLPLNSEDSGDVDIPQVDSPFVTTTASLNKR